MEDNLGSLASQLREARREADALAAKFGEFSQQSIAARKKVGELRDAIGDARATADALATTAGKFGAVTKGLATISGGFTAIQGAMGLIGREGKAVEETFKKVQSAMALTQGLTALSEMKDAFGNLKLVAVNAFTAIKAAIGSTGIGILIVGLGTVLTYLSTQIGLNSRLKEQEEELLKIRKDQEEQNKKTNESANKLIEDQIKLLESQGKTEEALKLRRQQATKEQRDAQIDLFAARVDLDKKISELEIKGAELKKIEDVGTRNEYELNNKKELKQEIEKLKKSLGVSQAYYNEKVNQAQSAGIKIQLIDQQISENAKKEIDKQNAAAEDQARKAEERRRKRIAEAKSEVEEIAGIYEKFDLGFQLDKISAEQARVTANFEKNYKGTSKGFLEFIQDLRSQGLTAYADLLKKTFSGDPNKTIEKAIEEAFSKKRLEAVSASIKELYDESSKEISKGQEKINSVLTDFFVAPVKSKSYAEVIVDGVKKIMESTASSLEYTTYKTRTSLEDLVNYMNTVNDKGTETYNKVAELGNAQLEILKQQLTEKKITEEEYNELVKKLDEEIKVLRLDTDKKITEARKKGFENFYNNVLALNESFIKKTSQELTKAEIQFNQDIIGKSRKERLKIELDYIQKRKDKNGELLAQEIANIEKLQALLRRNRGLELSLLVMKKTDGLITEEEFLTKSFDLNQEFDKKIGELNDQRLKKTLEKSNNITKAEKESLDARQKNYQEFYNEVVQGLEIASKINNLLLDLSDLRLQKDLANIQKRYNAEIAAAEAAGRDTVSIEERKSKAIDKINAEAFERNKKYQYANAVIEGASSVLKALGSAAPPLSFLLAGLAGAATAVQIAKIQATTYESSTSTNSGFSSGSTRGSRYQTGGLLIGPSHDLGGIRTSMGELEGGEFVINRRSTDAFLPLLEKINSMGNIPQVDTQTMTAPGVVKAYVVASDMTNQQQAEIKLSKLARL